MMKTTNKSILAERRVVIVGGGIAGTSCAAELRCLDPLVKIVVINEENHRLYSRVLLPHYVVGRIDRKKCFLKSEAWYDEQKIELLLGCRVNKLDSVNKFLELSDGREMPYDQLVIAGGAEPRAIANEPRGVTYFWTLDDVDHMLQIIKSRPADASQAIIHGGGFIAGEFLRVFKHYGLTTTIFFRGKHFWNKILGDEAGQFLTKHLLASGIQVCPETELIETVGGQELTGVKTTRGEIAGTMLGVAVGNQPELTWLNGSGVEVHRGVLTNEYLETNLTDVYAIGDIAESFDPLADRQYSVGNWARAREQGLVVARTLTNERTAFVRMSAYAIDILGLGITFLGDVDLSAADDVNVRKQTKNRGLIQTFIRSGRLVGVVIMGDQSERTKLTAEIQNICVKKK